MIKLLFILRVVSSFQVNIFNNFQPLATCNNSTFSGIEVNLFNAAASSLNLIAGKHYTMNCIESSRAEINEKTLSFLDQKDTLIFGGVPLTSEILQKGIASKIAFMSKLVIIRSQSLLLSSMWIISKISPVFFGMAAVIWVVAAFFLYLFDHIDNQEIPNDLIPGYYECFWFTFLFFFRPHSVPVKSIRGKLFMMGFYLFTTFSFFAVFAGVVAQLIDNQKFTMLKSLTSFSKDEVVVEPQFSNFVNGLFSSVSEMKIPSESAESLLLDDFNYMCMESLRAQHILNNYCSLRYASPTFSEIQYSFLSTNDNGTAKNVLLQINQLILNSTLMSDLFFNSEENQICNEKILQYPRILDDPLSYSNFNIIIFSFFIMILGSLIAMNFRSKVRVFTKKKKRLNRIQKELKSVKSAFLKKLDILLSNFFLKSNFIFNRLEQKIIDDITAKEDSLNESSLLSFRYKTINEIKRNKSGFYTANSKMGSIDNAVQAAFTERPKLD